METVPNQSLKKPRYSFVYLLGQPSAAGNKISSFDSAPRWSLLLVLIISLPILFIHLLKGLTLPSSSFLNLTPPLSDCYDICVLTAFSVAPPLWREFSSSLCDQTATPWRPDWKLEIRSFKSMGLTFLTSATQKSVSSVVTSCTYKSLKWLIFWHSTCVMPLTIQLDALQ